MSGRTLVWTRSRDDWAADAPLLARLPAGVPVLHLPCVALVPQPVRLVRASYEHVVLTSVHAVDFALADAGLAAVVRGARGLHTHGKATAARLRERGLQNVDLVDARTAAELGEALAGALPEGASVLVPTAAEPAFDLAGWLHGRGLAAEAVACYATAARAREADGRELSAARRQELQATLAGVACFASPSAVAGFAAELLDARLAAALVAAVIGPTTAAAAEGRFARVVTARENSLASLLEAAVRSFQGGQGA